MLMTAPVAIVSSDTFLNVTRMCFSWWDVHRVIDRRAAGLTCVGRQRTDVSAAAA
jgi:hypothetical protein